MSKNIKKALAEVLIFVLLINCFSIQLFAQESSNTHQYTRPNGETIEYYIDNQGNKYIRENDKKVYIAIPEKTEVINTSEFSKIMSTTQSINPLSTSYYQLPYSKTMSVGTGDWTDVILLNAGRDYIFLKCSKYKPLLADKGVSYYIFYSDDGTNWISELYVNYNLTSKLKHFVYDSGYPYVKIRMWSYTGALTSCLLEIT